MLSFTLSQNFGIGIGGFVGNVKRNARTRPNAVATARIQGKAGALENVAQLYPSN